MEQSSQVELIIIYFKHVSFKYSEIAIHPENCSIKPSRHGLDTILGHFLEGHFVITTGDLREIWLVC